MRLAYDFESNGLFADTIRPGTKDASIISRVHCLVTQDVDTGEVRAWYAQDILDARYQPAAHGSLRAGVEYLLAADWRYAHNGSLFDERVLREFFPDLWAQRNPAGRARDTQAATAAIWPGEHLRRLDAARIAKAKAAGRVPFPGDLVGRHSLEAWGTRLGNRKAEYPGGWAEFNPDMLRYCVQDVSTLTTLVKKVDAKIAAGDFSDQAWELEQDFKVEIAQQVANGFAFDAPAAAALAAVLQGERAALLDKLTREVPPFENHYLTEKKKISKVKVVPFNPGSRGHIARHLMERHGWKPDPADGYTPSGEVKIDETVLEGITGIPIVRDFERYLLLQKRLSQIAEKNTKTAQPWLNCVAADGRIHGRVDHCGAVSSRCTHSSPNMSAVPKVGAPFGRECRALFVVGPGHVLVGGDVKALEPRFLGHYLEPFDGGDFIRRVVEGTLYERVVELLEIPAGPLQRDTGKRAFLAWLYGAGGAKLGKILGRSEAAGKRAGRALRAGLQVGPLQEKLKSIVKRRGTINLPDGRRAFVRSEHAALNTLLQGSGAVLMKRATVLANARIRAAFLDAKQVGIFHDELEFEADEAHAEAVARILREATEDAGREFNLRVPMVMETKVGRTWAEVH